MTRNSVHARLLVKDYQACLHFYRDILEFEVNWDDGDYAGFQDGDMRLAIFKRDMQAEAIGNTDKPLDAECQDKLALIFEVQDVDAYHQHLKSKGVQFIKAPLDYPDWGIRAAYFRDPDGNLIEINCGLKATEE
jgi:catechol 2,3-dioxygenase-like lactoylglutathione lyase family enzyme